MIIDTFATHPSTINHGTLAGIDVQRLKAMRNAGLRSCFNHLEETPYRLQFVARIRGREYINDAAARTVNSTWYSLERLQGNLIWIAEAPHESTDYSRLTAVALRKVQMMLVVGDNVEHIVQPFKGIVSSIVPCTDTNEALTRAYRYDPESEVKVLYSPACHNGESTELLGERFRHLVNEL